MANKDDNIAAAKQAAFDHITALGKAEGQGALARTNLAEYVCQQAHEGVFGPDDADLAWDTMMRASLQEQELVGGSEQTFRQRVSDIRHFIVLGINPDIDGPALLSAFKDRMAAIRRDRQGPKGRTWPMLLNFAQAQAPLKHSITQKQMDALCDLPTPPKRKAVEKFWSIREMLNAANERIENRKIRQAIELIETVVNEMGGTRSQKKAQKKAEAKAKAKIKKTAAKLKRAADKAKTKNGTSVN